MMKFRIGDKAFYPAFGVCSIRDIESKDFGGARQEFYVLEMQSNGATVRIPTTTSRTSVIRQLISARELESVYSILKTPRRLVQTNWNRRQKEFKDKIRSGSIGDIAQVVRDLASLRTDKGLSSGAKDLMDDAVQMMAQEISEVTHRQPDDVVTEINQILVPS